MWCWLSTEKMTVLVRVDNDVIVEAPPVVRKFVGQRFSNLTNWMNKQPGFRGKWLSSKREI